MRVLVLGAGVSGLSAALHLLHGSVTVLEAEHSPGGIARTRKVGDFLFDRVGQFIHARDERVQALLDRLLPDGLSSHQRNAAIHIAGTYVPHPFQANLAWLPDDLRRECLDAFLAAHRTTAAGADQRERDLLEWFRSAFGDGIVKHFLEPQNRKTYCCDLKQLKSDWIGAFVPQPTKEQVLGGALKKLAPVRLGYNANFLYPRAGGIQRIPEAMAAILDDVKYGKRATGVFPRERRVHCSDGTSYLYDRLISTMPLTDLVRLTADLPDHVHEAAAALRSTDVVDVAFGIDRPAQVPHHWIYFPEPEIPMLRAVFSSNVSAALAPAGKSVIHLEANFPTGNSFDGEGFATAGFEALKRLAIVPPDSCVEARSISHIRSAYVLHDRLRESVLPSIQAALSELGIFSIGRYGGWRYGGMESALLDGIRTAQVLSH